MNRLILILSCSIFISAGGFGQVFKINLNQADPLNIAAGNDTTICPGHSVTLGSSPTATGGTDGYLYFWTPVDGLDNPTSPNPIATPSQSIEYFLTVVDANGCELSESVNITIDLCLGIENSSSSPDLRIYPNPSSGNITISGLTVNYYDQEISLLNSMGTEVLFKKLERGTTTFTLDLKSLGIPEGIYFIRILSGDKVIFHKVQLI